VVTILLPRSQLRLAAELLPRHITSLSQRLDYMQQLLVLKELPVVERCELAARLLLSLRGDLVPRTQQPAMGYDKRAWWQVQVWHVPVGAHDSKERQALQSQLGTFLKEFMKLAGQVRLGLWHVLLETMLHAGHATMLHVLSVQATRRTYRFKVTGKEQEAQPVLSSLLTLHHANCSGPSHCKDILLCLWHLFMQPMMCICRKVTTQNPQPMS
jgi:hypothetical protein